MSNLARNAVVVPDGPLPMLPPSIWESEEVRDAVAAESLGTLAGFSQAAISHLESGSNIAYAIDAYTELMPRWGSACQWEHGLHMATLAYAHASSGDVDQAVELGFAALGLARVTGSRLIVNELARLGPWAAPPAIAELTAQLR